MNFLLVFYIFTILLILNYKFMFFIVHKNIKNILNLAMYKKLNNGSLRINKSENTNQEQVIRKQKLLAIKSFIMFIITIALIFIFGYFSAKILGLFTFFTLNGRTIFIILFILYSILDKLILKLINKIIYLRSIKLVI